MAASSEDDGMSSISPEEVIARQTALDAAAAEFLGASRTGVFVHDLELYTDGTFRPTVAGNIFDATAEMATGGEL